MKEKFRALKGSELLSLKDKWLMRKGMPHIHYNVTDINTDTDCVIVGNDWRSATQLLNDWIYTNDKPVGIEIELSSDGYTLEEFLVRANDDCSNVEFNDDVEWHITKAKNREELSNSIVDGLDNYRIKPTPKYIRPKVGFRGRIKGEFYNPLFSRWEEASCVSIINETRCEDPGGNGIGYLLLSKDNTSFFANEFRLLPFSAENPPPVGTRFRKEGWDSDYWERYYSDDKDGGVFSENGKSYKWSEVEFIDFEKCKET